MGNHKIDEILAGKGQFIFALCDETELSRYDRLKWSYSDLIVGFPQHQLRQDILVWIMRFSVWEITFVPTPSKR